MTRPPNDRGQGRKPIKEGEPTVTLSLRITEAQREKLSRLGGAAWVRARIDKAKVPTGGRSHANSRDVSVRAFDKEWMHDDGENLSAYEKAFAIWKRTATGGRSQD